jgi:hypothetical protein
MASNQHGESAKSLLQRALTDLDRGPDDIVELFGPDRVREIALAMLRGLGCKLDGDPNTVELLIQYAREVDVEPWLREWRKSFERPRRGRPPTDLFDATIYAAALSRAAGVKEASAAAAKWLGPPATKDRVEKNAKFFRKVMSKAYLGMSLPREVAVHSAARIILDVIRDLEALEAKMTDEKAAAFRAKKNARHASFSAR